MKLLIARCNLFIQRYRQPHNQYRMLQNYFKNAWRNLRQNKTNSILNLAGLAIGIACAGLIFLWVEDELNFDSNQLKKNQLYLVNINAQLDNGIMTHSSTPGVLAPVMQADIPELANTCRMTDPGTTFLFGSGQQSFYATGKYADPSIFAMFTLPFVQGNAHTALNDLQSLVITEKTAKRFFGNTANVVGKTIRIDNKADYVVTGVIKDMPENSSLRFDWIMPFEKTYRESPWLQRWNNYSVNTFVELKPGTSEALVNKKLYSYINEKAGGNDATTHAFLFSMNNWYLRNQFDGGKLTNGGRIQYVRLFSLIAAIILFIACINFMNLATARSEKRAREVGVRKVLGAGKKSLVLQFIGEAVLLALLSGIIAVLLIMLLLPAFNSLVQKNLTPGLGNPLHLGVLLIVTIVCGLVAGSYPSFYLSSFNPVYVLKGIKLKTGSANFIRKGLVVVQFSASIVLMVSTVVIYLQIQHIKSRNLGFDKNNLLQMNLTGNMLQNFPVIKQELINTGMIENAALADHETIEGGNNTSSLSWEGKNPNSVIVVSQRLVSAEYFQTLGMKRTEGRDFVETDKILVHNNQIDTAQPMHVVITESMAAIMGKGSAIGKLIRWPVPGSNFLYTMQVVGVIKDYVYGNMYGNGDPVVFYYLPSESRLLYVRLKPNAPTEQVLAKIAAVLKKNNPAYPFEYRFVDDQFNAHFLNEMLMSKLSRIFATLAIVISCLGLFGLAAYTAERRTKEIGIRKVLGASAAGLAGLLSKDFIKLVALSCLVAFPLAAWMMHNWLQGYAYRIHMSIWVFVCSGVLALLIALFTVSFQALKAAMANPVKSLRAE